MGISGQPAISSTYSTISKTDSYGPYSPGTTSISLIAMSSCVSEAQMTNPGKCPAGGNSSCTKQASFFVSISIKCDAQSNTATSCTNFADSFNTDIPLNDPNLGKYISIAVSYNTNICDTTGASSSNYLGAYYPNSPTGTIKILPIANLNDGQVISVQLKGVDLLLGNDTTKAITLNGTYAGKIITQKACTK